MTFPDATAIGSGTVSWGDLRLRETAYLSAAPPPERSVTSVRALVLKAGEILLERSPNEVHIVPGGRREAGESYEETVRREVLEESGWHIEGLRLLGFKHFRHLTPEPPDYPYPYPDFTQLVYGARATVHEPAALTHDYELGAEFVGLDDARLKGLPADQTKYLEAALAGSAE